MRVVLDSWALKLSRVSASTTLLGSWFQKHMACGKNDVLYTVVLVCGTRNHSEWPLVRREVRLRWCSAGISTRLYTMRYILVGMTNLVFCSGNNGATPASKPTIKVFNMQRLWLSSTCYSLWSIVPQELSLSTYSYLEYNWNTAHLSLNNNQSINLQL